LTRNRKKVKKLATATQLCLSTVSCRMMKVTMAFTPKIAAANGTGFPRVRLLLDEPRVLSTGLSDLVLSRADTI